MKPSPSACTLCAFLMVLLLAASTPRSHAFRLTFSRLLQAALPDDVRRDTQGNAYSSAKGQNPGGAGDAFTWYNAESSSTSSYDGVYYRDGTKTVLAGERVGGGWAGAFSKNSPDSGTTAAVASNFDPEYAFQRGVHTVANTYEGARAVAGSNTMWGLAKGGTATWTMDSYGPTAIEATKVGPDSVGVDRKRSTAATNIAPMSAAQSGIGAGPAAVASGFEVSSAARAGRDKKVPVTVGSRDADDAYQAKTGLLDKPAATGRHRSLRLQRRQVMLRHL